MDIEALRRLLKGPAYANGSDIITNAVRGGRCKEFVEYGLGLRLNRKTRKTWIGIVLERNAVLRGKKKAVWYSVFEKELWLLWRCHYQMACPRSKVTGGPVLDVSGSARKVLARTGLVRYHKTPVKEVATKAFSDLWGGMQGANTVMWLDNWYYQRWLKCPGKPDASLDVSAMAILHIRGGYGVQWTGHIQLQGVFQHFDVLCDDVAIAQQNIYSGVLRLGSLNGVSPKSIRAPLDVARGPRSTVQWRPFMMSESRTGTKRELLDLLAMLKQVQQHTQEPLPLLIDSNIYYQIVKLMHCKYLDQYDFGAWMRNLPMIYGVWHPYKHVCNVFFRRWLPLLAHLMHNAVDEETVIYSHPKLIVIEKLVATIFVHGYELRRYLREKIMVYEHRAQPHTLTTVRGLKMLHALRLMISEYVPAIFQIGCLVRNCHWDGTDATTAHNAKAVLHRCMVLMLRMSDGHEHQVDYIRTINMAMLHWTEWHDASAGELHSEEICEAMLSRLSSAVRSHPNMHTLHDIQNLFLGLPRTKRAGISEGVMPMRHMLLIKLRLKRLMVEIGQVPMCTIRWSGNAHTKVRVGSDHSYEWPLPLSDPIDKAAFKDILKRNLRACIGGLRPSPEVEAFVRANVPVRSPDDILAFRRCLKDLGANPAPVRRAVVPPALQAHDRRGQVVVVEDDEPPAPVHILIEDVHRASGALDAQVVSD